MSTWNGSPQRELATNTLSGKLGADHFPDRAGARLAGLRAGIRPDAGLVGQVSVPVGEPGVVFGNEDLPLVAGQRAASFAEGAVRAEAVFVAGAAVDVRASGLLNARMSHFGGCS